MKLLLLALTPLTLAGESFERLDPAFDELIAKDAAIETLATGFRWAEGPVWDEQGKRLLFSDVPRNTIYQWPATETPAGEVNGVSVYLHPSGYTGPGTYGREPGSNGLAFDSQGRLVCCEHGDRRLSVLSQGGGKMTLADRYRGKRFNSPNDLAIHSSGDIFFTDPPYGLPGRAEDPRRELPHFGVYRLTPEGQLHLLISDLVRPNGIALTPDESTLYVAQSHRPAPYIMAYSLNPDRSIAGQRRFFDCSKLKGPGNPDGLKVHPSGTLFATGPGGVLLIDSKGKLLGRILCGRPTANLAFAPGHLFITSGDRLLRVPLKQS